MKWFWFPEKKDAGNLSANDIIENSAPYIHKGSYQHSGVYFLLDGEEIVYVGKSIDVKHRLEQHSDSDKIFNRFFFIQCEREQISSLEAYYILQFRPKYNIAIPKGE